MGYMNHMEYFDCGMDIRQGNTVGRAMMAFMPYNKSPKTPFAIVSLGLRQIAAYVALFPRAERCGILTKWSQSPTNPTTDFELTVKVKRESNGEKLFFRGRKTDIQVKLRANGQPAPRAYRMQINLETSPNRLNNKIKIQMNRAPVPQLGIKPYTVCMSYRSRYPDFGKEFMAVDFNEKLAVAGQAQVQYGEGTECGTQGDIKIKFNHETTQQGSNDLKEKWYYKQCMAQKQSPEWRGRGGNKLPTTEPCWLTLYDATSARHYHWEVEFVKLTNRMKNIISNARALVQAGLIPYYDESPDTGDYSVSNDVGPFLNADVTFKNSDKNVDLKVETSQGLRTYNDYPLSLEWTQRLRNMKLDRTIGKLIQSKIIYPCVATVGSVQTNDNVTYAYDAGSCYTLMSGNCGPTPAYGVFQKKVGNKLAVKAYFGGHEVQVNTDGTIAINGAAKRLKDGKEEVFENDGVFLQVLPAPSTRGQHCGMCGTFNRNIYDE